MRTRFPESTEASCHDAEMHVYDKALPQHGRLRDRNGSLSLDEQSGSECSCQESLMSFKMTDDSRADRCFTPCTGVHDQVNPLVCGQTWMSLKSVVSWCQVNRADRCSLSVAVHTTPHTGAPCHVMYVIAFVRIDQSYRNNNVFE